MNYYEHHLGDYDAATAHLTWIEDMAYARLLRLYYRRERPIPTDISDACRLVRAQSKEQKTAVESVLREFFQFADDGWHQERCDEEIGKYQRKAEHNRTVGKLGGRPKKTKTQPEPANNPAGLFGEPKQNPPQTPDPRPQTPIPPDTKRALPIPAGEATRAMREAGIADANPSHPKLTALLQAGISVDELRSAAEASAQSGKGFAYALATAEGRRRDAVITSLPGARTGPGPSAAEPEWRREQRERMEQAAPYAVSRPTSARTTPETFTDDEATDVLPLARPTT